MEFKFAEYKALEQIEADKKEKREQEEKKRQEKKIAKLKKVEENINNPKPIKVKAKRQQDLID
jgi:hypothetical protein